jgi:selenocysteine lyase/cysteine desulfurase
MDEKRAASALRLSPHYYNTEDELASVVEALRSVTARVGAAS